MLSVVYIQGLAALTNGETEQRAHHVAFGEGSAHHAIGSAISCRARTRTASHTRGPRSCPRSLGSAAGEAKGRQRVVGRCAASMALGRARSSRVPWRKRRAEHALLRGHRSALRNRFLFTLCSPHVCDG